MTTLLRTAIVYDFDGTLAPRNLSEHTFLPAVGIAEPEAFWSEVKQDAQAQDGCEILTSMHRMLEVARAKGVNVTRAVLQEHDRSVPLFAGVEQWFDEIDAYGREKGLAIERACQLLASTQDKVESIAEQVGFENAPVFSRAFKRWVGRSPKNYRE